MRKMVSSGLSILTLAVLAMGAPPAERHSPAERYGMFQRHLGRRATDITRKQFAGIDTLEQWKQVRPARKKQMLYMLGLDPMPERTPLNARVTGGFQRNGYRVENLVFESIPGMYVTGNLYLPDNADGPAPTVLYLCGHSPWPAGNKKAYQHHGIWFARHGYVAFVVDSIEYGEVRGAHHGTFNMERWFWLPLGYTPAGPEVWNAIRALDYLETRPEVDPKRVAVTGISGGGASTWYAAAADERFSVAAPVCATWTAEDQVTQNLLHENCDCIYFHAIYQADLALAGALIAPRPLKILNARQDSMFPPPGYHGVFKEVRPIYELYGTADKMEEYDHEARHSDILPFRKEADEWINRWLKDDRTPFEEGDIQPEDGAVLRVLDNYPADAINGWIDKVFIPAHEPEAWKTLEDWRARRTELLAELKDKVFRAFPAEKAPFHVWKDPNGGWPARYADMYTLECSSEEGVRVTGQLLVPKNMTSPKPALIFVKRKEDDVNDWSMDSFHSFLGNHVVLVWKPRGVGYPAMDSFQWASLRRTVALTGATIESMQVWDILRAVDYLIDEEKLDLSSISVYGRREMGAVALYAAALDERIDRVVLDDPPSTHWQGPALLNVLRLTDLPEAAALMAPREIVSLTPLPEAYDYTRRIYELYGKPDHVREAMALEDALKFSLHEDFQAAGPRLKPYSGPFAYGLRAVPQWRGGGELIINLPEHLEYETVGKGILRHNDKRPPARWEVSDGGLAATLEADSLTAPGVHVSGEARVSDSDRIDLRMKIDNGGDTDLPLIRPLYCAHYAGLTGFPQKRDQNFDYTYVVIDGQLTRLADIPAAGPAPKARAAGVRGLAPEAFRRDVEWAAQSGGAVEGGIDAAITAVTDKESKHKLIVSWTPGKSLLTNSAIPCIHADPYYGTIRAGESREVTGVVLFTGDPLDSIMSEMVSQGQGASAVSHR